MSDPGLQIINQNINKQQQIEAPKHLDPVMHDMNIPVNANPDQINAVPQAVELKADEQIKPLAKEGIPTSIYSRADFARKVGAMNAASRRKYQKNYEASKENISAALGEIAALKNIKLPKDIKNLLKDVQAYANIRSLASQNRSSGRGFFSEIWEHVTGYFNAFGNRKNLKRESELTAQLPARLNDIFLKYVDDEKMIPVLRSLSKIQGAFVELNGNTTASAQDTREQRFAKKGWNLTPGTYKELNDNAIKKFQTTVDNHEAIVNNLMWITSVEDRRDTPLFPHEPTIEDVSQGSEGNCWFMAVVSTLSPKQIKDMMLDNGDGTVTVRFYQEDEFTNKIQPVYVTVNKTVKINGAWDCFWIQILEKAYTLFRQTNADNTFKYTSRKKKGQLLPDKQIPKDTLDYGFVANGGHSNEVLGHFLGGKDVVVNVEQDEFSKVHYKHAADIFRAAALWGDKDTEIIAEQEGLEMRLKLQQDVIKQVDETKDDNNNPINLEKTKKILRRYRDDIIGMMAEIKEVYIPNNQQNMIDYTNGEIDKLKKKLKHGEHMYNGYIFMRDKAELTSITLSADIEKNMDAYNAKLRKLTDDAPEISTKKGSAPFAPLSLAAANKMKEQIKAQDLANNFTTNENWVTTIVQEFNRCSTNFVTSALFKALEQNHKKTFKVKKQENGKTKNKKGKEIPIFEEVVDTEHATYSDYEKMLDAAEKTIKNRGSSFKEALKLAEFKNVIELFGQGTSANSSLAYDALVEMSLEYIKRARAGLQRVGGIPPKSIEGDYSQRSLQYYEMLDNLLHTQNRNVVIGTRNFEGPKQGSAGESAGGGMVGTHAYSVHDCKSFNDGKKMVLIRNPWSTYSPQYKYEKGMLESDAVEEGGNGMFWIELNHLMNYLGSIYANAA